MYTHRGKRRQRREDYNKLYQGNRPDMIIIDDIYRSDLTPEQAKQAIKQFNKKHPEIKTYFDKQRKS